MKREEKKVYWTEAKPPQQLTQKRREKEKPNKKCTEKKKEIRDRRGKEVRKSPFLSK